MAISFYGSYTYIWKLSDKYDNKNEEIKAVGNKNESNVFPFFFKHILSFKVQQSLDTWKSAEEGAGRRDVVVGGS